MTMYRSRYAQSADARAQSSVPSGESRTMTAQVGMGKLLRALSGDASTMVSFDGIKVRVETSRGVATFESWEDTLGWMAQTFEFVPEQAKKAELSAADLFGAPVQAASRGPAFKSSPVPEPEL